MKTRDEAIAYLKSLGLQASERVLSGETAVFVGAEPVFCTAGVTAFKKGVCIRPFNRLWTVLEMSQITPVSVYRPTSLREACDVAAALLTYDLHISIAA